MEAWIWSETRLMLAIIVCIHQAWHTDWKAELMLAAARLCRRASEKLIFDSNLRHFTKLPLPTRASAAITWLHDYHWSDQPYVKCSSSREPGGIILSKRFLRNGKKHWLGTSADKVFPPRYDWNDSEVRVTWLLKINEGQSLRNQPSTRLVTKASRMV